MMPNETVKLQNRLTKVSSLSSNLPKRENGSRVMHKLVKVFISPAIVPNLAKLLLN